MPLRSLRFPLIFILPLLILLSCRKEKCPDSWRTKYLVAETTKPYFNIVRTGSNWIYQNPDSTKKDTIRIISADRYLSLDEYTCNEREEFVSVYRAHYFDSIGGYFLLLGSTSFQITARYSPNHFGVSYNEASNTFACYDKRDTLIRHSSVQIGSRSYSDVFEYSDTNFTRRVLWAKGVGIIRWIQTDSTGIDTFNLKHYSL